MIEGSCLCGGVRYRLDEAGAVVMNHCHCSRCRKASGAEYATFLQIVADYFDWISGEELIEAYESTPGNFRTFCRICGSRTPVVRPQINSVTVPVGSLESDPSVRPEVHLFAGSRAPWYEIPDDLKRFEEMGTAADWQPYIEKSQRLARRAQTT